MCGENKARSKRACRQDAGLYGKTHRVALTGKSFSRQANTVRGDTEKIPVSPGWPTTRIPYLLL